MGAVCRPALDLVPRCRCGSSSNRRHGGRKRLYLLIECKQVMCQESREGELDGVIRLDGLCKRRVLAFVSCLESSGSARPARNGSQTRQSSLTFTSMHQSGWWSIESRHTLAGLSRDRNRRPPCKDPLHLLPTPTLLVVVVVGDLQQRHYG